ncbi:Hypothetical protein Minf_2348 [Methylacidiphilum infernorum V4]|uniref:Uncharacterized protein n=1 Tax=Methylacidiphilum infernorum (isolate V4) TaxID=481448 RepID=B3E0H3_METI4|nr:Hypothetical protein Minf_2348 [Methylacidiphilum infernorum V4]
MPFIRKKAVDRSAEYSFGWVFSKTMGRWVLPDPWFFFNYPKKTVKVGFP